MGILEDDSRQGLYTGLMMPYDYWNIFGIVLDRQQCPTYFPDLLFSIEVATRLRMDLLWITILLIFFMWLSFKVHYKIMIRNQSAPICNNFQIWAVFLIGSPGHRLKWFEGWLKSENKFFLPFYRIASWLTLSYWPSWGIESTSDFFK